MKRSIWFIVCIITGLFLAAGLFVFASDYEGNAERFVAGTVINGVDCSGMTVPEAQEALTNARNGAELTIERGGETLATLTDLNLSYEIEDALQEIVHGSILRMHLPETLPGNAGKNKTVPMAVSELPESMHATLTSYNFLNQEYTQQTQDAYVDLSDFDFNIVPEVQGDNIDKERFVEAVLDAIRDGKTTLAFQASDYYDLPNVTADDPDLLNYQEFCKEHLSQQITLEFFDGDMTIPPSALAKMKVQGADGNIALDEEAITAYAVDLANAHTTVGGTRTFTTASGATIEVSGGNYGYIVDAEAEAAQLKEDLQQNDNVTREPNYSAVPYGGGKGVNGDIGNSYAEVDVSAQTAYLFIDGQQIISTPVVTGKESTGHATPSGVFGISYLDRNATLRGRNDDGTKYESKVKYWMPFNGGIGFHDADWRRRFGGSIYITNGSHGCVNMPPSIVPEWYSYMTPGFPVVVHR